MEESHQINAECISCSFKGSVEVKKGKKIYGMTCTECGKKTLRERRRPRRIKVHEPMDSDNWRLGGMIIGERDRPRM